MQKNQWFCMLLTVVMGTSVHAEKWSYKGETAPDNWAKVDQSFQRCSGYNQSPINITNTVKAELDALKFDYHATTQTIVNNGHTVQVDFSNGGNLYLDGDVFALKQFHLHTPSENQINGQSYPLEAHFVHMNKDGALAVVGVMYKQGLENMSLARLWEQMPKTAHQKLDLVKKVKSDDFLPKNRAYYRFSGSLTTPPCTEGVRWLIFKEIQSASPEQIKLFADLMDHNNSRPVQPLHGRMILE